MLLWEKRGSLVFLQQSALFAEFEEASVHLELVTRLFLVVWHMQKWPDGPRTLSYWLKYHLYCLLEVRGLETYEITFPQLQRSVSAILSVNMNIDDSCLRLCNKETTLCSLGVIWLIPLYPNLIVALFSNRMVIWIFLFILTLVLCNS